MSDTERSDTEQSFDEWLTERVEEYRESYEAGPRSENPRQTDIALGRLRAFKDARTEYLNRKYDTDTDRPNCPEHPLEGVTVKTVLSDPAAVVCDECGREM